MAQKRAGSFTSFLFQELRCQCAQPALPKKERLARTNTQVRRLAMAEKRGYTANLKANTESGSSLHQADFSTGAVIGGAFKIYSAIGAGGMGTVYLAQHLSLNRPYALKVLSPSIVSEQSWLRFKAEAKTLSVLNHPGLVKVYDLGIHENTVPYYSMDYLEGETLEDLLVRKGPQELEYTISIFLAVLDALAYAHRNNVVHRDIKPANIFICQNQEIKILDFGISKLVGDKQSQRNQELTAIGEVFGSPYYMSPEQCRGEPIDFRSDIYSVGCALFETLTGYVPFESGNSLEIAMLHEEGEIPLLSDVCDITFPLSLDVVFAKCMAKLPQDRYQSAKEMAIDLTRIKEGKNLEAYAGAKRSNRSDSAADKVNSRGLPARVGQGGLGPVGYALIGVLGLGLAGGIYYALFAPKSAAVKKTVTDTRIPGIELTSSPIPATESSHFLHGSSESARLATVPAERTEKLTARTQAEVIDYLHAAPKYYSQIVSKNGRRLKVFTFPSTFSLGEVTCSLANKTYTCQAQEKLGIPINSNVALSSDMILQFNPELLSHFRSDDLHSLTLDGTAKFADPILQYISRLTSLRVLVLRQVPLEPKNIKYLNCLTNLYSLKLADCHADPATLLMLTPLHTAARISLDGGANVSALLKVLSRNPHLAYLQLGEATLSKRDVASLASMRSLESLSIRSSSISNEDIEALTVLTNLRYLILHNSKTDEKCVKSLLKFHKLECLVLSSVEMPLECKVRLQKALPKLRTMQFSATDNQMFDLPDDSAK